MVPSRGLEHPNPSCLILLICLALCREFSRRIAGCVPPVYQFPSGFGCEGAIKEPPTCFTRYIGIGVA